jgi:hypothetical protein
VDLLNLQRVHVYIAQFQHALPQGYLDLQLELQFCIGMTVLALSLEIQNIDL